MIWIQLVIPYRLCFEDIRLIDIRVAVVDLMIDIFFLLNTLMTFFVPIYNWEGISYNYLYF